MSSYGSSTVKQRRTNAELGEVDAAIVVAVRDEHPVSLRGVYYRVVSAGVVEKTEAGYRLVGRQLIKLRRDGRVPYFYITDGTRLIRKPKSWSDLGEMLEEAARGYRRALWRDQPDEVIVLSEKDAISGVIYPVTSHWDVELAIARGYPSVTFCHSIAQTVRSNAAEGKITYLYQLGDHDPSGLDAWRDFRSQVTEFAGLDDPGLVAFERLAVTPAQIQDLGLPTRPTKQSDSRARNFAGESVEVDAIPPSVLREILNDAIESHIDPEKLRLTKVAETSERDILVAMRGGAS